MTCRFIIGDAHDDTNETGLVRRVEGLLMTRGRVISLFALAALVAVLFYGGRTLGWWGQGTAQELTLFGNVEIREVELGFRVSGRIEAMPVDEGDRVAAGTLLATLDQKPFVDVVAGSEAEIGASNADLARQRNGNRAQDIAVAQSRVTEAQALLDKSKREYERRRVLLGQGFLPRASVETAQADYLAAQARVQAASDGFSLQKAGARTEDVAKAEAQRAMAVARASKAHTDLEDTRLLAPSDGVIMTRVVEPGTIVQAGQNVFTLAIERPVRVRAYVPEVDLGRIAPGLEVTLKTDGRDRLYHGRIGYISPSAEFTPKSVQTESQRTDLVYRLRIIVSDADTWLRQGQPVTIQVPKARPAAAGH
jgi:HlyD family secretion protein